MPGPDLRQLKGKWVFDPAHTRLGFSTKHMMVSTVRGHFTDFDGAFNIPDDPSEVEGKVTIRAASVDTGNEDRDNHLRSNDFFAMDEYPEITFEATGAELVSEDKARVHGNLTVRGVTRPVTLDVVLEGHTPKDAFGNERAGFSATTTLDRESFGLKWNKALEGGGWLVGKDVKLELDIAAVKQG